MSALPAGWHWEPLSELTRGGLFCDGDWVESKDQDPTGSVRLTQLADVGVAEFRDRSDRWLREDQAHRLGCTFLAPDDVLIARMPDPLGRACLAPEGIGRAVTAVDVAIARPSRQDLEPRFLMWALNAPDAHTQMVAMQSGTTRKRISRKNLGTVRLPVPPRDEQRRVVDILEDHLSRLDAGVAEIDRADHRLVSMREQWLRNALPTVLPPDETTTIAKALVSSRGGWSRSRGHIVAAPRGVPYLKMNNITRSGHLALDEVVRVEATDDQMAQYGVASGDVLFNSKNSGDLIGKTAVADSRIAGWVFNENIMRLRFDGRVLPGFARMWFLGPSMRKEITAAASASTNVAAVYMHALRDFRLWIPALPVQERLTKEFDRIELETDALRSALADARQRASRLKRSLLAAAFSGSLTGHSSDLDLAEEMAAT